MPFSEERPQEPQPLRYQMPNLEVEDTFRLPLLLGWQVRVTAREGMVLLFGWSLAFHLWRQLLVLIPLWGWPGLLLQWGVALLLALGSLLLAKGRIEDRSLEAWALVLLRAARVQKRYVWKPISTPRPAEEQPARVTAVAYEKHAARNTRAAVAQRRKEGRSDEADQQAIKTGSPPCNRQCSAELCQSRTGL